MKRKGFTLIEVLVALLVFEVGLLGVVGTLVLAARTMTRAETLERGVMVAESLLDSLLADGSPGAGRSSWAAGDVSWTRTEAGLVDVTVMSGLDTLVVVRSRASSVGSPK